MSDKPTPEQARTVSRSFRMVAESYRAAGMEQQARQAEQQAQAWQTGTAGPTVEPELAALLRIEDGQKAMRDDMAAILECLQRIEKLLAAVVQR